ncbi:hypothetical protein [Cupriavidus oxalaticus]|uniref:hypothetical protein n=1 Tax=Cupriavidus oxalaticus TaxID=96344 RepID=UPI0031812BB0
MTAPTPPAVLKPVWKSCACAIAASLLLAACQTAPVATGLSAAQITVLQREGFALTSEGWELGLTDKVLFGFNEDLEVRGLGKSRPVADNRTAAGRAENRRVAIIVSVD